MISIDEMEAMLEEIIEKVPEPFFRELNGGILLLPEAVEDEEYSQDDDLYVLGEYCQDPIMGNYICIYYGSFEKLMPDVSIEELREELEETVFHEFTHHVETLAGEYGLDIKDMEELQEYLRFTP